MRNMSSGVVIFGFLVLVIIFPFVVADTYWRHIMIVAFIYAIIASNWDLSLGYAGIFNFAQISLFGIGLYGCAISIRQFDLDPWLGMLVGGCAAVVAAALVALPAIRLKGVYVVLVTFAFGQLVLQIVLSQPDLTGGTSGITSIPSLKIFDYNFARDFRFGYYFVALSLLIASTIFSRYLVRSDFGVSLRALRDNEDYALSRGIPAGLQRMKVLMAGALFTGIAGGFYGIYLRVAAPDIFGFSVQTLALSMVLIGGIGTIYGPIAAAICLTLASEFMGNIQGFDEGRVMLISVAMIVVLLFFPSGLATVFRRSRRVATDPGLWERREPSPVLASSVSTLSQGRKGEVGL
jgi:branched-chain amino acid transport system permease protein